MHKHLSRRSFLGLGSGAGGFVLGSVAAAGPKTLLSRSAEPPAFPWPYREVDPAAVRNRAYISFDKGGCMFGVFEGIAASVADKLGNPYTNFPFALSSYGGGGIASWGSLCGTCNGAAMAISLFHTGEERTRLTQQIFAWYEENKLPTYVPAASSRVKSGFEMAASRPDSVLCHVSISRWTGVSGFASYSPERLERCARLVADVAGFAAELLNKSFRKEPLAGARIGEVAAGCLSCHAQGRQAPGEPETVSRMTCTTCHEDAHHQDKK